MNKLFESDLLAPSENDIAVIGMAGRFPGACNVNEFWQNLEKGVESISHFSDEALKQAGTPDALLHHPRYVKAKGVLQDIEQFDAHFFNITPYEASITDPQHRLFLEVCWEALESAGYASEKHTQLIGVFAGMSDNTYLENVLLKNAEFSKTNQSHQVQIANSSHFLAEKISYYLNLKGPSLNISTACSSTLVTIIKACQSLTINECDLAIAGGSSIRIPHLRGYLCQEGHIYSADGTCRAFDKEASGTVSGSCVGAVILKRLSDALKDRDTIDAVIRSYAINNDGAAKAGFTAPSVIEQSRCIATALAGVDAETIQYIETHGTGTLLGDPIEVTALTKAFRHYTERKNYCALGSVKTNIGHADAAAGIAGFIKTVLALKHKIIPASLHFKEPNPYLKLDDSPFYVNQQSRAWPRGASPRRAGVSSFGMGGTNAHLILEEAPEQKFDGASRAIQIILLSAKTPSALIKKQEQLLDYVLSSAADSIHLADIAYTLQQGRKDFSYRKTWVCATKQELAGLLNAEPNVVQPVQKKPKSVFLFPGQGTLFPGTGKHSYATEAVFKEHVDHCLSYLDPDLSTLVLRFIIDEKTTKAVYEKASIQQPALFILEYSLAKTLMHWGIQPDAMLGHSLGEYTAACLSEVLSLADTLHLIVLRGRLTEQLEPGSMLSVPMHQDELAASIENRNVDIAAINAPRSCVISGEPNTVHRLQQEFNNILKTRDLECALLNVQHAFHSSRVESILGAYLNALKTVLIHPKQIPYISNLTGEWITDTQLNNSSYFIEHFRKPVLFSKGIEYLVHGEHSVFIEVGIGHTLTTLVQQHSFDKPLISITTLPNEEEYRKNKSNSIKHLQEMLAQCWLNNISVHWENYYENEKRCKIPLPTYPFERSRHWLEPTSNLPSQDTVNTPKIYEPFWELAQIEAPFCLESQKSWLIFIDAYGIANPFMAWLKKYNQHIVTVQQGSTFKALGVDSYQMNPKIGNDYQQLFKALSEKNKLFDYVIHCWSLTKEKTLAPSEQFDTLQYNGFLSLIYFVQAFLHHSRIAPLYITVMTNKIKKILVEDNTLPEKATLLGSCLVIPQEYQQVICQAVDLDDFTLNHCLDNDLLIKNILSEVLVGSSKNLVAYRQGLRFIQQFKEQKVESTQEIPYLQKNSTYLITGGLGKIGIKLAGFLAKNYKANLILLGRTILPPMHQWDAYLAESCNKEHTSLIQALQKIREQAQSLSIVHADISHYDAVKNLLADKIQKGLDGIFHLAAIANPSARILIKDLNKEEVYAQFMPKIQGVKVIQRLTEELPVKFCLLYSSIASVIGGIGLASYAASNCCLDSLAEQQKNHSKTRWGSISWDAWQFSTNNAQTLKDKLDPEQAMKILVSCCQHLNKNAHFVISTTELIQRLEKIAEPLTEDTKRVIALTSENSNPQKNMQTVLTEIFKDCLGVTQLNMDMGFYEMGGDSLSALRLLEMVERQCSIRVTLSDFLKNNSIKTLTTFLQNNKKMDKHSSLVGLRISGNKEPIFLVHPVGGHVFCYLTLATHLSTHHPCYGIADPRMELNTIQFNSIEEMATAYIADIQCIQPHGPYFIGGFSFGANIAFEIAKQLEFMKESIGGIFLIDGWAKASHELRNYETFCETMQYSLNELNNHLPKTMIDREKWLALAWDRMQLMFRYQYPRIDHPIVLFKAKEILPEYISVEEAANHWENYTSYPISLYTIPGNHRTILQKEGALEIANKINDYIKRFEKDSKVIDREHYV